MPKFCDLIKIKRSKKSRKTNLLLKKLAEKAAKEDIQNETKEKDNDK